MAICRNQPRAHEGQMVSGEKGGNCSALWLCVGIVERWWNPGGLTGIEPQRRRAHGGRTNGDDYPEAIVWAFQGWMERNAERLCELCASVVHNRS